MTLTNDRSFVYTIIYRPRTDSIRQNEQLDQSPCPTPPRRQADNCQTSRHLRLFLVYPPGLEYNGLKRLKPTFSQGAILNNLPLNYLINLLKLLGGKRNLRPLVAVYHVTQFCNLNCRYCEDYGIDRNPSLASQHPPLPLADARRLLGVIRQGTDQIIFTGGEPLLYLGIDELIPYARRELKFRGISLLTNGLLLPEHQALLRSVDRLIVSLDSVDPHAWDETLRVEPGTAARIIEAVRALAGRQRELGLRFIINCVITPETLDQVEGVVDFCAQHRLTLSLSPQTHDNWPRYELMVSDAYRALMHRLADLKRNGFPLLVSAKSLHTLSRFEPFKCYPTLFPQVMPDGGLVYPCRPIQKSDTSQGGLACNLLEVGSWDQAMRLAVGQFGEPPLVCTSCFQQCYVEPSRMQAKPLSLLWELLRYPTTRRGGLATLTTG